MQKSVQVTTIFDVILPTINISVIPPPNICSRHIVGQSNLLLMSSQTPGVALITSSLQSAHVRKIKSYKPNVTSLVDSHQCVSCVHNTSHSFFSYKINNVISSIYAISSKYNVLDKLYNLKTMET